MKAGVTSWAFRYAAGTKDFTPAQPLTHGELLVKAHWLGAQVVQICENMALDNASASELAALRQQAAELGLSLEVGTGGARRQRLARYIEIARALNARVLRVVEDMKDWKPAIEDIAAEVSAVLPACREHNVVIAIENHFSLGTRDLARLVRMVDDERFGVCLDTLNSIARLEGWREALETLVPYAVSLHVKDAASQRIGAGFHISGRPMGQGMIDFAAVLAAVRAHGRDPNVLVEGWMDTAGDAESTLRQEEKWIADGLAFVRPLLMIS